MQTQLNSILDSTITSFAGSTNTKRSFMKFSRNLYQMGVRAEMIKGKEGEILKMFWPQNTATSGQVDGNPIVGQKKPHETAISREVDDSNIMVQSQLPAVSNPSGTEILYTHTK